MSRFHNGPRRINIHAGPDKVLGQTLQSRGHASLEQEYLREVFSPADAHFSPQFLEDWSTFTARIELYERRIIRSLEQRVPCGDASLSGNLLVNLPTSFEKVLFSEFILTFLS